MGGRGPRSAYSPQHASAPDRYGKPGHGRGPERSRCGQPAVVGVACGRLCLMLASAWMPGSPSEIELRVANAQARPREQRLCPTRDYATDGYPTPSPALTAADQYSDRPIAQSQV